MKMNEVFLEQIAVPDNYEEVILKVPPLNEEMQKQGFHKGMGDWNYWQQELYDNHFRLGISSDEDQMKYTIYMFVSGDIKKKYYPAIKKWAEDNDMGNKNPNFQTAMWISEQMDAAGAWEKYPDDAISLSAPSSDAKLVWIQTEDRQAWDWFREDMSVALRTLDKGKSKSQDTLRKELLSGVLEDVSAMDDYMDYLEEIRTKGKDMSFIWSEAGKILKKHGFSEETIPYVAFLCATPDAKLEQQLSALSNKYGIKAALDEDESLAEEMFIALQQKLNDYYIDNLKGYATKEQIENIIRMFASACRVLGFGIYYNSIETVVRVFHCDVMEGIGLDWYRSDDKFSHDDLEYYDGIEHLDHYDKVWAEIDIKTLVG